MRKLFLFVIIMLPILFWIGRSEGQQRARGIRPPLTPTHVGFGAATAAHRINQADLGRVVGTLLRRRCAAGYRHTGQSEACRARLNMINVDACNGEAATEAWWSCSLERPDFSCPSGGQLMIANDMIICIYHGETPPQSEFSCPAGYMVSAGEFCVGEGTYCCSRSRSPCGLGAIWWTSVGNEACCDLPIQGPC